MLTCRVVGFIFTSVLAASALAQNQAPEELETINVAGVDREWRLFVPTSYDPDLPTPLVLDFHGTGSSPRIQAALSDFETTAEQRGFIVVSPAAKYSRKEDGKLTWNVDKHSDGVNDVEFVAALISHVSQRYTIDRARVFATGMSGGARMSSRVACDLSDLVAAIGPVGGIRYPEDCSPSRPVPVITFHGKQDRINHYEHQPDSPEYWRMGVEDALSGWVKNNKCAMTPVKQPVTSTVTRISYSDCRDGADVEFYQSSDAGHTWPGSPLAERLEEVGMGKTNRDVPATTLIWQFFEAHAL